MRRKYLPTHILMSLWAAIGRKAACRPVKLALSVCSRLRKRVWPPKVWMYVYVCVCNGRRGSLLAVMLWCSVSFTCQIQWEQEREREMERGKRVTLQKYTHSSALMDDDTRWLRAGHHIYLKVSKASRNAKLVHLNILRPLEPFFHQNGAGALQTQRAFLVT